MRDRILIVNPNSTQAVTDAIADAIAPLGSEDAPFLDCRTLSEGPPGIESEADITAVEAPLFDLLEREKAEASIIACFSDPGLERARNSLPNPVYGIGESAFRAAMGLGERFGIVAILDASTQRHARRIEALGLQDRFAASLAVGLGVKELLDEDRTMKRLTEVGQRLRDEKGADVLVLGCAGMAGYQGRLQAATGLRVVEPCRAAVSIALQDLGSTA